MLKLPKDVEAVKQYLFQNESHEFSDIAEKLMQNKLELVCMWETLEKYNNGPDDFWVWAFLKAASDFKNLPPFHFKTAKERNELSDKIANLTNSLSTTLKANGLDAHLIHNDGKMFNGFFLYEDFGESNRASIDADGVNKVKISELLETFAERTREIINKEPIAGKRGKNEAAIRFVRLISERNILLYDGKPLNRVIATAANALFQTDYTESSIAGLRNR